MEDFNTILSKFPVEVLVTLIGILFTFLIGVTGVCVKMIITRINELTDSVKELTKELKQCLINVSATSATVVKMEKDATELSKRIEYVETVHGESLHKLDKRMNDIEVRYSLK